MYGKFDGVKIELLQNFTTELKKGNEQFSESFKHHKRNVNSRKKYDSSLTLTITFHNSRYSCLKGPGKYGS